MNRSNGSSQAATKATASDVASKTKKSDTDGVVVSFDSDNENESSGDDDSSEEEEEEGRSSSASSAPAESEGDPSSEEEDGSADEAGKSDGGDASKSAEKDDEAEKVTYKLTLEPSNSDVNNGDEDNEENEEIDEETTSAKNSDDDDDDEDGGDGSAEASSEEEEQDHTEDIDTVSKRRAVNEEADDEDETQKISKADDSAADALAEIPEASHVNGVRAADLPDAPTHNQLTVTSRVAEITTTLEPSIEQPPSTASAADRPDDYPTVGGDTDNEVRPPVILSESLEEDEKQKKKTKKKRHGVADDNTATGDEVSKNVVEEESRPDDDQRQPINVIVSGDQIDKPDLLPTVEDDREGHDIVESIAVQSSSAAKSQEPATSRAFEQSTPLDNADITSNLPAIPKEKKKKKHATASSSAAVDHAGVVESAADGVQQKCDSVATAITGSVNADVPIEVEPATAVAIAVDITETARAKLELTTDEQLPPVPGETTTAVAAPEVEDEKEGKKKKKKKKTTDRSTEDKPSTTAETGNTNGDLVNEEPNQGVRRNSIDEFIRRILAEAREEQKKRTEDIKASSANDQLTLASATSELSQKQPTVVASRVQPDVVQSVNGDGGKKNEETGFVSVAAATTVVTGNEVRDDHSSESSMLDRRLASTERKREQESSASVSHTDLVDRADITRAYPKPVISPVMPDLESKAQPIRNGISGMEDIDQELADISRIFAKRAPLNLENGIDDDEESASVDGVSGWLKSRPRLHGQTNGTIIDDNIDDNDASSGILSSARRFSAQFGLAGVEEFIPARRPETDEIIRGHLRPVRAVIEQQADVIQKLKSVGRDVSQLDVEIRDLRQSCIVDRRSAVDSMLAAVAEETRLYEAEQRAADERVLRQLAIVRFVREQIVASVMSPAVSVSRTRGDIFDRIAAAAGGGLVELSFVKPPSQLGYRGGGTSIELPTPMFSRRAQSVAPGGAGDFLDTGRRLRGGSVTRDASSQRVDTAESVGDESNTIRKRTSASINATQWSQSSGNDTSLEPNDGDRRSRLLRAGSVGPSWYSSSSFDLPPPSTSQRTYDSGDTSETGRRHLTSTFPSIDAYSSSGEDSTPSHRFSSYRSSNDYSSEQQSDYRRVGSGSSGYASSYSSLEESSSDSPSRYARRFSIADATNSHYSDRFSSRGSYGDFSTYSSGGYVSRLAGSSSGGSGSGGEFQSKFLDKVRERKAKAAMGIESSTTTSSTATTSSSSSGVDKPFKSRFLKPSFDSDPPPTRRYTSTTSSYD